MKASYSRKPNQEMTHEVGNLGYNLMIEQASPKEDEWLSHQFCRIPFLLYKFWLILHFAIILIIMLILAYAWLTNGFVDGYTSPAIPMAIGFIFFLYGCIEMLYAMKKKKSRVAQEGFVQFQYALISSVSMAELSLRHLVENPSPFLWLQWSYMVFSPVVNLVGGRAVLGVFKKNHPLTRMDASKALEDENKDFLEQNEAIASEFSKYDKQLRRCPYFIYKWVLKFSVVFEIIFIFQDAFLSLSKIWQDGIGYYKTDLFMYPFLLGWVISSLLNAYSCFQMEIATRTKNLTKAQNAIGLFKICIVLSVIKCPFVGKCSDLDRISDEDLLVWFLSWFACSTLIPVFGLLGALKVKKILEERETFVKVSSYSQDTYL